MRSWIVLAGLSASCASLPAYQPGSARVLTNDGGVRVEMVRAQEDPKLYYVRITGAGSAVDDYVLAHTFDTTQTHHFWSTSVAGRSWTLLFKQNPAKPVFKFQLNPAANPAVLEHDREASKTLDVEELLRTHVRQRDDGSLARLQEFDRGAEETGDEEQLRSVGLDEACGATIAIEVDWQHLTDEQLLEWDIASYCREPLAEIKAVCTWQTGRQSVQTDLRRILCRAGSEYSLELADGTLTYTMVFGQSKESSTIHNLVVDDLPWSDGALRNRIDREQAVLCADGKGHYVGNYPHDVYGSHVIYYDGERWLSTRPIRQGRSKFFDPRFTNPGANPNLGGVDYRFVSHLVIPDDRSSCMLRCGTQDIELRVLGQQEKLKVLPAAPEPAVVPRKPHGLARDRRGNYYLVDVGGAEDARDFRVFVGPKGDMKQLAMKNVVTDSAGDIFVTKSGELRLILEKPESLWVAGKRTLPLKNLPLADNWDVIYNQLGPYIGTLYGTPCDHM